MERYAVEDDGRLSALIEAARRGDEAVLTQGGEAVATVVPKEVGTSRSGNDAPPVVLKTRDGGEPRPGIDWEALKAVHECLPPGSRGGGAAAIRELRDMGY